MTRRWGWTAGLVVVAAAVVCVGAAQKPAAPQSAEQVLGVALHQEEVEGDLRAAIATYEQVLKVPEATRAQKARAQFRIGACYERLGLAEARKAYEAVISQYGDQGEFATQAKARLGAMASRAAPSLSSAVSRTSLLWKNPGWGGASLAPDGRSVAFVDTATQSLWVRDVATGADRNLVAAQNGGHIAFAPFWSPDGSRIAYTWMWQSSDTRSSTFEVRVVDVKIGTTSTFEATKKARASVYGWSADGRRLLLDGVPDGWAWFSIAEQALTPLQFPSRLSFDVVVSPDGSRIAYSDRIAATNESGLFVAPADGSSSSLLLSGRVIYTPVAWTPDGTGLLATSQRSGRDGLWMLPLDGTRLDGAPRLLQDGFTGLQFRGLSRAGALLYSMRTGLPQLTETEVNLAESRLGNSRALDGAPGADWVDYPSYSPDGRHLAYFAAFGDRRALVVKTLDEPKDRVYFVENLRPWWFLPPTWSADGRAVFVGTVGEATICRIDLASGGVEPLVSIPKPKPTSDHFTAVQPDGRSAYIVRTTVDPRSYHLWRLDISSGTETEVYRLPRQGSAARISPDGRWLAFDEYGGAAQTYSFSTLPAAGGAPQPVCTLGQLPRHFEVSADSRWLVIQTMNLSKQVGDIWVAPLSGGEPRPLTMRGNMNSFSLHPDGTRIAFGNRTKPDEEVWLLENFLPPVKGPKDH